MRAVVRWFGAHAAAQGCGYLLAWCSGVAQSNNRGLTAGQEHGMHEMNGCAPAGVRAPDLWSSAWADSRRALDGAGGAGEAKTREDLWSTSAGPQKKKDVLDAAQRSRAEDGACGRAARVEEGNLSTALQGGCWHTISTHQPAYRTRWHAADRAGGRQQVEAAARSLSADDNNARGGMPSAQQHWGALARVTQRRGGRRPGCERRIERGCTTSSVTDRQLEGRRLLYRRRSVGCPGGPYARQGIGSSAPLPRRHRNRSEPSGEAGVRVANRGLQCATSRQRHRWPVQSGAARCAGGEPRGSEAGRLSLSRRRLSML